MKKIINIYLGGFFLLIVCLAALGSMNLYKENHGKDHNKYIDKSAPQIKQINPFTTFDGVDRFRKTIKINTLKGLCVIESDKWSILKSCSYLGAGRVGLNFKNWVKIDLLTCLTMSSDRICSFKHGDNGGIIITNHNYAGEAINGVLDIMLMTR